MTYGETTAWMCGLFAGAIIGVVAAYALLWRVSEHNHTLTAENRFLRVLLYNLQSAETDYRSAVDQLPHNCRTVTAAWDRLRRAGDAARLFLFSPGKQQFRAES